MKVITNNPAFLRQDRGNELPGWRQELSRIVKYAATGYITIKFWLGE